MDSANGQSGQGSRVGYGTRMHTAHPCPCNRKTMEATSRDTPKTPPPARNSSEESEVTRFPSLHGQREPSRIYRNPSKHRRRWQDAARSLPPVAAVQRVASSGHRYFVGQRVVLLGLCSLLYPRRHWSLHQKALAPCSRFPDHAVSYHTSMIHTHLLPMPSHLTRWPLALDEVVWYSVCLVRDCQRRSSLANCQQMGNFSVAFTNRPCLCIMWAKACRTGAAEVKCTHRARYAYSAVPSRPPLPNGRNATVHLTGTLLGLLLTTRTSVCTFFFVQNKRKIRRCPSINFPQSLLVHSFCSGPHLSPWPTCLFLDLDSDPSSWIPTVASIFRNFPLTSPGSGVSSQSKTIWRTLAISSGQTPSPFLFATSVTTSSG
ncbi:hypothetical protein B0T20DRAFT_270954 [Sordaria brevicollis]|uniref:Uncharacterized protein n=1 Tax=Sordaria brevicollis TaxID=83679 RepID=A0AAE0PAT7_SORBR|nr:hypothetical protein B0T20DRAFT_270954 [Sordaria brevicollis]